MNHVKNSSSHGILSQVVYEDHHKINTKLKINIQDWAWFERDGTQAMIINNDRDHYLF